MLRIVLKNKSILWGLLIALGLLLIFSDSALSLYKMGVFNQENMILGGDPSMRSAAFAYGYGERSLIHPNLSNFVNPIVRILAAALSPVFPELTMKALQMQIALWVSPVCAMLATYMIYLIALTAGVRIVPALALSTIYGFSISTMAYGSIPDHFLISAFLLTIGLYLLQINARLTDRQHLLAWVVLATLTAGITSSNVIPMLGLYAIAEYTRKQSGVKAMVIHTGLMFTRVAALTILLWGSLNWVYHDSTAIQSGHAYNKHVGRVLLHLSSNPLRDVAGFPFTVGQAFWGGRPDLERDVPSPILFEKARYESSFVYNSPLDQFSLQSMLWLIPGLFAGASLFLGFTRESQKFKPLASAVILIIMFNWLLHSFWGNELFLFSPHWHFAVVIGLIPLLRILPTGRGADIALVLVAVFLVTINLGVWGDILHQIPSLAVR